MEELIKLMSEMQMAAAKEATAKNVEIQSLIQALGAVAAAYGWQVKDVLNDPQKLTKCKASLALLRTL